MSVHIRFVGGLGNQMFQYAFLYSMLKTKEEKIYGYFFHTKNETPKKYALNCFPLSLNIKVIDEVEGGINIKIMKLVKFTYRIYRKLYTLLGGNETELFKFLQKWGVFINNNHAYYYFPVKKSNRVRYVEGLYQSYRYFDEYKEEIKQEFTVKSAINKQNEEFIKELSTCESVCVHIRRGDYTENAWSKLWAVCDNDYYQRGIEKIKERVMNPVFYIFSNSHEDIEWIKENYDLGDVKYIDLGNTDFDDFRLMYNCKHFVISNSTYSWWAQYLASNPDKIVVAPSMWHKGKNDDYCNNIYMPGWQIIEV